MYNYQKNYVVSCFNNTQGERCVSVNPSGDTTEYLEPCNNVLTGELATAVEKLLSGRILPNFKGKLGEEYRDIIVKAKENDIYKAFSPFCFNMEMVIDDSVDLVFKFKKHGMNNYSQCSKCVYYDNEKVEISEKFKEDYSKKYDKLPDEFQFSYPLWSALVNNEDIVANDVANLYLMRLYDYIQVPLNCMKEPITDAKGCARYWGEVEE